MTLEEFLLQVRGEVREVVADRLSSPVGASPFEETVFTEIVMEHMAQVGMTFEPQPCHYAAIFGKARLRLSGYAVSEDADQLDLFVSLYEGSDEVLPVPEAETKAAAEQCLRFLVRCAEGSLAGTMDPSNEAYLVAQTIQDAYPGLDQIRIYVLTDRRAKARNFKGRDVQGKTVRLEVMDIERLWRHWSAGKPRDELVVDFGEVSGGPLPCVFVPGEEAEYDYALTALPGEALRFLYEKYGPRLLEANVRSFLSAGGKVNKGVAETLRKAPDRFMAYNNGVVIIADEMRIGAGEGGAPGLLWLRGMQIVNGGQTTASLYFTKKKSPDTDLRRVRVPAKIIVLRSGEPAKEEQLVSDISRYANSQNAVKLSDLSANKPFHVEIEKLSLSVYCPDGASRWFYERAAGSYMTMLAREGATPAKLRKLKTEIPASRKLTKTDLARVLNAWDQKPHVVSLGLQKNFDRFMNDLTAREEAGEKVMPDVAEWKRMIARVILFKAAHREILPMFPAFQVNVTVYAVSLLAWRLGERLELERIWERQALSPQLLGQIRAWAQETHAFLQQTAEGRMISEWAKKAECWERMKAADFSAPQEGVPEVK